MYLLVWIAPPLLYILPHWCCETNYNDNRTNISFFDVNIYIPLPIEFIMGFFFRSIYITINYLPTICTIQTKIIQIFPPSCLNKLNTWKTIGTHLSSSMPSCTLQGQVAHLKCRCFTLDKYGLLSLSKFSQSFSKTVKEKEKFFHVISYSLQVSTPYHSSKMARMAILYSQEH